MTKSALITGITGQDGICLVRLLLDKDKGPEVRGQGEWQRDHEFRLQLVDQRSRHPARRHYRGATGHGTYEVFAVPDCHDDDYLQPGHFARRCESFLVRQHDGRATEVRV